MEHGQPVDPARFDRWVISEDGQRALPHDGNLGTFGTHHNLGTAGSGQWKYDPDNLLGVGGIT